MGIERYFLGCPIWGNKAWVGELFAAEAKQQDFLRQYASVFNTVEGNTTFYGLPTAKTAARWLAHTPKGFRFALKFPRVISHTKRLRNAEPETAAFMDLLATLQDRIGPSFLQLPPAFGPRDLPALDEYLTALPNAFHYAVEIRHNLFFAEAENELTAVLKSHRANRVVFDTRGLHSATSMIRQGAKHSAKSPRSRCGLSQPGDFLLSDLSGTPKCVKICPCCRNGRPWLRIGSARGEPRLSFSTRPMIFTRRTWPAIFTDCCPTRSMSARCGPGPQNGARPRRWRCFDSDFFYKLTYIPALETLTCRERRAT